MKSEIKNVHKEAITLFAKIDGVEKQVSIPSGESIVVDTYDTKTIRVFRQRGFITMHQHAPVIDTKTGQINLKYNQELVNEDIYLTNRAEITTFDSTSNSNNDEPMDHFHTTETIISEATIPSSEIMVTGDLDRLDIVAGEVEQYIEGGYVKGEWTDEDIDFLKKNYSTKGRKYCSVHLNRNESSVQKKINALGLKKKKKKK